MATLVALATLCLLALVLFLVTLFSIIIPFATLQIIRVFGRIYYYLNSEWLPPLLLLIITIVGIYVAVYIKLLQFQWWNVPLFYAFLWLILVALQARKRLVIGDFTDYTNDQPKPDVQGLATLLVTSLGQLHDLYRTVDEQRAIPTSVLVNECIDAAIEVEDVSEFLTDAVNVQSKVNVGPVEIPLGTIMGLIGRLVQGPRIIGSLHKDKDFHILTAQKIGGKQSFRWRVDRSFSPGTLTGQDSSPFVEMIGELAYRIFTDLALPASVRWKATASFSEGLRAYRECLRTPRDRIANLKEAEKRFVETLTEDVRFDLAYYNLGVVYTELERKVAAGVAFEEAISQNPNSWIAYYALALNRFEGAEKLCQEAQNALANGQYLDAQTKYLEGGTKYDTVIQLCKRVIDLKPGNANIAKAYQAKGLGEFRLFKLAVASQRHTSSKAKQPEKLTNLSKKYLKESYKSRLKAVNQSWKALCTTELRRQNLRTAENTVVERLETLASICLANLAQINVEKANYSRGIIRFIRLIRAERLYKKAISLNRSDADYYAYYHFSLGETYFQLARQSQLKEKSEVGRQSVGAFHERVEKLDMISFFRLACYDAAAHEYRIAARITLDRPDYWAKAALAYAKVYALDSRKNETDSRENESKKISALRACELALTQISLVSALEATSDTAQLALSTLQESFMMLSGEVVFPADALWVALDTLGETYKALKMVDYDHSLSTEERHIVEKRNLLERATRIEKEIKKCESSLDLFREKRAKYDPGTQPGKEWEYALFSFALAQQYSKSSEKRILEVCCKESIRKLEEKREKYAHHDWAYGYFSYILGKLHSFLETGKDHESAEKYFREAREKFKGKHPLEIRALSLRALQAFSLLKQGKSDEALQEVEEAIVVDPLTFTERAALGDVYYELREFKRAIDTWQDAILRKNILMKNPHDPEIYFRIGNAYVQIAQQRRELSQKNTEFQQAINYLKIAIDLYRNDQSQQKQSTYYSLGYFHFSLCEYDEAISYLRICQKFEFAKMTSTFYLAYAYLRNRGYDECIEQFRRLQEYAEKRENELRHQGESLKTIVDKETNELFTLGEMLALACWGQAFAYTERNVNLQEALNLINKAHRYIHLLDKYPVAKVLYRAKYPDCKGWILYKLGKFDDAIRCLEQAVTLTAHAEIYLHLALAYEGKLNKTADKSKARALIRQAQTCCLHVKELSINGQCNQRVDDLLQRLEKKSQEAQAKNPLLFWQ